MGAPDHTAWTPMGRPELHTFVPRERHVGPLLLWIGALTAALALLVWLGRGALASPDLTAPSTWATWAAARGTAATVVTVMRIVALWLAWYLVGVTSVSVLAHAARAARLARLADALAVGPVRVVVQQALGVSLAVGVVATALPSDAFGPGRQDDGVATVVTVPSAGTAASAVPLAGGLVSGPQGGDVVVGAAGAAVPAGGQVAPVPAPTIVARSPEASVGVADHVGGSDATAVVGTDAGREVRVEAGDHLWGIAEEDLRRTLARAPTEAEIADHWLAVIAANTDRLVVPSNPDLLHPGQRLVLPDVEVAP